MIYKKEFRKEIKDKTVQAAQTIRVMKEKYKISVEDLAAMHKAYARIHGEHILLETLEAQNEIWTSKQPIKPAKRHFEWVRTHLLLWFESNIKGNIAEYKGRL